MLPLAECLSVVTVIFHEFDDGLDRLALLLHAGAEASVDGERFGFGVMAIACPEQESRCGRDGHRCHDDSDPREDLFPFRCSYSARPFRPLPVAPSG